MCVQRDAAPYRKRRVRQVVPSVNVWFVPYPAAATAARANVGGGVGGVHKSCGACDAAYVATPSPCDAMGGADGAVDSLELVSYVGISRSHSLCPLGKRRERDRAVRHGRPGTVGAAAMVCCVAVAELKPRPRFGTC